jgi:hypothetical protein
VSQSLAQDWRAAFRLDPILEGLMRIRGILRLNLMLPITLYEGRVSRGHRIPSIEPAHVRLWTAGEWILRLQVKWLISGYF